MAVKSKRWPSPTKRNNSSQVHQEPLALETIENEPSTEAIVAVKALCELMQGQQSEMDKPSSDEMEEIAQLAEAAGIHTCKLDLEDLLLLEDWYACTGSYQMPCRSCLAGASSAIESSSS